MSELPTQRAGSNPAGSTHDLADLSERQAEKASAIADRIFAAAQPGLVFSAPVTAGTP